MASPLLYKKGDTSMKYANLHLHSTHSDCQLTPEQLILIGKSLGYRALALTDHETDSGVKDFLLLAKKEGIQAISGCEFYGKYDRYNLHLTALDYDMEDPCIRRFIKERVELETECTRKRVELGIQKGFIENLKWDDVIELNPDGAWICIDSVINTMRIKKLVPADYNWTAFRNNVFKSPEALSFAQPSPSAEEVIKIVRKAGGVVALAHPIGQTHLVDKLVDMGLNGIEVSHPDLPGHDPYLAAEAADTFHLYRCGGTDHTGPMSGCGGNLAIPVFHGITEEEFTTLRERRLGR